MLGLEVLNDSGNVIVSAHTPAFVYIGKAQMIDIKYMSDKATITKAYYIYVPKNVPSSQTLTEIAYAAPSGYETGYALVWYGDPYGYAGYSQGTFQLSDTTGIATYQIYSLTKPIVFVSGVGMVSGAVASITNSGVMVNGKYRWIIKVFVAYPNGSRSSVSSTLKLYCFAKCENSTPSGYGLALYDSNGVLCYSTDYKPLIVRDTLSINNVTGSTYSNLNVGYSVGNGSVYSAVTPAFLSTDWFRASHYQTTPLQYFPYLYVSGSNTFYYPLYYPNPPGNVKSYAAWISQNMVGLGFSVQSNSIMFNIAATDMTGCGITTTANTAGTVSGIVTNQLPMTIPIIDGAMYD